MLKVFRDKVSAYFNMGGPWAATWSEWRAIEKEQRAKYPVRWFLTHTLPMIWFRCVTRPYSNAFDWVWYRTIGRYNTTIKIRSLRPGYWDPGTRLLHGAFSVVVDYVEIECAYVANPRPWLWVVTGKRSRNAEAGLAQLKWMSTPEPDEPQLPRHDAGNTIIELYDWWVNQRPLRPDAEDVSGMTAFRSKDEGFIDDLAERQECLALWDKAYAIEAQYETEDTANLVRLISARMHMWT